MNKDAMIARAHQELEDVQEDVRGVSQKIGYATALSLLALHYHDEQIVANTVATAVHNWFLAPSGETFTEMQVAIGAWRSLVFPDTVFQ